MLVTLLGMVTDVSPLQPENAYSPMLVTLLGMVTDVSLLQPWNAKLPIPTVPSLNVIDVLLGMVPLYMYATLPAYTSPSGWLLYHAVSENAPPPMLVTLLGMVTDVSLLQ